MSDMQQAEYVYHRVIWALDSLPGNEPRVRQYWLMMQWHHCARLSALDGGDPEFFSKEVGSLIKNAEQAIKESELDKGRSDSEKQRHFLLEVVKRCLRAMQLKVPQSPPIGIAQRFFKLFRTTQATTTLTPQEAAYVAELTTALRYYSPSAEDFHADLGIAYYLWQGLRSELKAGITHAAIANDAGGEVRQVADAIKRVIEAIEHGDETKLVHYEKSALHLSEEQHRARLREAVVTDLGWILRDNGKGVSARLLALGA